MFVSYRGGMGRRKISSTYKMFDFQLRFLITFLHNSVQNLVFFFRNYEFFGQGRFWIWTALCAQLNMKPAAVVLLLAMPVMVEKLKICMFFHLFCSKSQNPENHINFDHFFKISLKISSILPISF